VSYDTLLNLILSGDKGVGRETLRERFGFELDEDERLDLPKRSELGPNVNVYGKDVEVNPSEICRLQVWEVKLNEELKSSLSKCVDTANGAVFLFDITNKDSLNRLDEWLEAIREINPDLPVVVVGNKVDIQQNRFMEPLDSIEYAHDRFCKAYIEISAKTGRKVEIAFYMVVQILKDYPKQK
jgi:GTPase SAR1 family protein